MKEEDGFPKYICNKCLHQLQVSCDFKAMVIQSDSLLHDFHQKNNVASIKKNSEGHNVVDNFAKEEVLIKVEEVDSPQDSINNLACNIQSELSEKQSDDLKGLLVSQTNLQNKNIANIQLQENLNENLQINPYTSYDNDKDKVDNHKNNTFIKSNMFKDNKESDSSESELEDFYDSSGKCTLSDFENENDVDMHTLKEGRKTQNRNNCNEKHALLLDNPELEKIMKSGLSKKEKDHATILCKICNKTFNFRYYVAVHVRRHTGNLPFKCDQCDKCFPRGYHLKQHMIVHSKTNQFACEECGKTFATIHTLNTHKLVHSDERPYNCDICNKGFKCKWSMYKHLSIHRNEKSCVCELCGKSFTHVSGLSRHKETHNTEKKYICTICKKAFTMQHSLQKHIKAHSGEKSYICNECGKGFTYSSALRCHLRIHTGAKPYKCKVCSKEFRQTTVLQRHMRTHTGETPFPCTLCPLRFKYKHHLGNHMKVHKIDGTEKGI